MVAWPAKSERLARPPQHQAAADRRLLLHLLVRPDLDVAAHKRTFTDGAAITDHRSLRHNGAGADGALLADDGAGDRSGVGDQTVVEDDAAVYRGATLDDRVVTDHHRTVQHRAGAYHAAFTQIHCAKRAHTRFDHGTACRHHAIGLASLRQREGDATLR